MKKRKLLITLLTLAFSATSAFALASCDDSTANEPTEIEKVYAQYVVCTQAGGGKALSYEKWPATIEGERGIKEGWYLLYRKGNKKARKKGLTSLFFLLRLLTLLRKGVII